MTLRHKRYVCPWCNSLRTLRAFPEVPRGWCESCHRPFDITRLNTLTKRVSEQAHSCGYGRHA